MLKLDSVQASSKVAAYILRAGKRGSNYPESHGPNLPFLSRNYSPSAVAMLPVVRLLYCILPFSMLGETDVLAGQ